jgi:hypothetical protein
MGVFVAVTQFTRAEYDQALALCIARGRARARAFQVRAARRHLTLAQAFRLRAMEMCGGEFPGVPWDAALLGPAPASSVPLPYAFEFPTRRRRVSRDLSGLDDRLAVARIWRPCQADVAAVEEPE